MQLSTSHLGEKERVKDPTGMAPQLQVAYLAEEKGEKHNATEHLKSSLTTSLMPALTP